MAQQVEVLTFQRTGEMANPAAALSATPQYSLGKILLIWAVAALPMGLLGWWVAPALGRGAEQSGIVRLVALTAGLAWQFVLVVYLLYRETGSLTWATVRKQLWLGGPCSPRTGRGSGRLWLWLIPVILAITAYEVLVSGMLDGLWVSLFPFLAEPQGYSLGGALESPEFRAGLVGNWGVLALFVTTALLNTVVGEELLFRGLLLPRMAGAFGKLDWVANGFLFGLYHLHQPWMLFSSILEGVFLLALPSRRFRCAWFGIIAHSAQSVFFTVLLLGLVLGLA